ncbi:MAG: outer membrane protein OmpA-like peptidoglycan-associated protein [Bacteroidia bacterium]|jgi:outer membrane protein OmpA-like peptidoglycan-associated protein
MKSILFSLFVLIQLVSTPAICQNAVNIISLEYGAKLIKIPVSEVPVTERRVFDKHSAGALFDQTSNAWSSSTLTFPLEFVIELAEEYNIQRLEFDNKCEFFPGIETKEVRVEVSSDSKDSGFQSVGEFKLEAEKLNEFTITPKKARWIKLVILSNHGRLNRIQLAEFRAIGMPTNKISRTVEIGGVWHTNWQDMTINQNGNSFEGSYVYTTGKRKFKGKVLNGKISRNSIDFNWDEKSVKGSAKLYLNQEGNQISGIWKNAENPKDFNLWTMTRNVQESKPIEYSGLEEVAVVEIQEPPVKKEELKEEPVEVKVVEVIPEKKPILIGDEEITMGRKIVLKNVFFELGKSSVTAVSHLELDKLFDFLRDNANGRVVINGHTDKIGDRKKNLILSKERADAIKEYLVGKGIEKRRISTEGKGDTETICLPPCKENRRVDFLLFEI